eukprot:195913_1
MWSSLNLNGVINSINRLKDGIELQMNEAITSVSQSCCADEKVVVSGSPSSTDKGCISAPPSSSKPSFLNATEQGDEYSPPRQHRVINDSHQFITNDEQQLETIKTGNIRGVETDDLKRDEGQDVIQYEKKNKEESEMNNFREIEGSSDHEKKIEEDKQVGCSLNDEEAQRGQHANSVDSLKAALATREGQLESAMSEMVKLRIYIERAESFGEGDSDSKILQMKIAEKDAIIEAYREEGEALSLKQSGMEQHVRRVCAELRERKGERDIAWDEIESLHDIVNNLRTQVDLAKEEARDHAKQQQGHMSTNQAATSKMASLEKEFSRFVADGMIKSETISRTQVEVKSLMNKLTAAEQYISEMESKMGSRDKLIERENILSSYVEELRNNMSSVARESARKDEVHRAEVAQVRKQWKDAIASSEAIAADAYLSTAPILAQIKNLQEEMEIRKESFKVTETTLSDRAVSAECVAKSAKSERTQAKRQMSSLTDELKEAQAIVTATQLEHEVATNRVNQVERDLNALMERNGVLESTLEDTQLALEGEKTKSKDAEARAAAAAVEEARLAGDELQDVKGQLQVAQIQIRQLESELETPRVSTRAPDRYHAAHDTTSEQEPFKRPSVSSLTYVSSSSPAEKYTSGLSAENLEGLSQTVASFATLKRLKSTIRTREGEVKGLRYRIKELEQVRDALTDEVAELGRRNAKLEEQARDLPCVLKARNELAQKNELLLEMVGERDEEMEALQSDLRDAKTAFRNQIEALLSCNHTEERELSGAAAD